MVYFFLKLCILNACHFCLTTGMLLSSVSVNAQNSWNTWYIWIKFCIPIHFNIGWPLVCKRGRGFVEHPSHRPVPVMENSNHMVYFDQILLTYTFYYCLWTGMQNGDEALSSIYAGGQCQIANMLLTLEQRGIF